MTTNSISNSTKQSSAGFSGNTNLDCGYRREFWGNRFVYTTVSSRGGGLCIGINMNPDRYCNFKCDYCDVDRGSTAMPAPVPADALGEELRRTLELVNSDGIKKFYAGRNTPDELMQLRQVSLSGEGEPTLCPNFLEAIQTVAHVRALGRFPFFKIVLLTNASRLDLRQVQEGLQLFTGEDEIWAKLEAGSQHYFEEVNGADCYLDKILENILLVGRQRPVVIQSLFPLVNHTEPSPAEIELYAQRLNDLRRAGAQIKLVQIYSANHPPNNPKCGHLSLKALMEIAKRVRIISGLKTRVF